MAAGSCAALLFDWNKADRLRKWVTLLKGSFTHPGDPPIISIRPKRKHFQWNSAIKKLRSHVNCFLYLEKQKTARRSHIPLAFCTAFTDWFKYISYKDVKKNGTWLRDSNISMFHTYVLLYIIHIILSSMFFVFNVVFVLFWTVGVVVTFILFLKICKVQFLVRI